MMYSILYKREEREQSSSLIYDLSVDRCVANISSEAKKNDYFCHILSNPLRYEENVYYRREILNDFISTEGLLPALKTLFNRYDKLKADWLELKGSSETVVSDKGSEAMLDYIYSSLKVTALFPKTILSFFSSISETLESYEIRSEGLCNLRDYSGELLSNRSLKEISDIAGYFMYNTPEDYDFDLVCRMGDSLEAVDAEICGVTKREKKKTNILSILVKKKNQDGIISTDNQKAYTDALAILGEAMYNIDRVLCDVTDRVYETFYGISRELDFYDVALRYTEFLGTSGKPYCYPEISKGAIRCSELYDLLLLTEGKGEVYPNDADFTGCNGVLIKGKNNTGKTTFLRSVAIAQLMLQAGLPVPCKSAAMPLYRGIYTHFSSAEEEFGVGDVSGRFEGEVKAVAAIMNAVSDGSLVILNETFQTTAYDEGTRAIEGILKALNRLGCQYIFVTHLTGLFTLFGDDTAKLESSGGDSPFTIGVMGHP